MRRLFAFGLVLAGLSFYASAFSELRGEAPCHRAAASDAAALE